jgi:hypothetical protein
MTDTKSNAGVGYMPAALKCHQWRRVNGGSIYQHHVNLHSKLAQLFYEYATKVY